MATLKQKKALERLVENRGNLSKSMVEAGYTKATAKNPSNLTSSVGFKQLVQKYLPDELLMQVHTEGLLATRVISAVVTGKEANEKTDDFIEVPDYATRHKYLVTGYEITGKLSDRSDPPLPQLNILVQQTINKVYGGEGQPGGRDGQTGPSSEDSRG